MLTATAVFLAWTALLCGYFCRRAIVNHHHPRASHSRQPLPAHPLCRHRAVHCRGDDFLLLHYLSMHTGRILLESNDGRGPLHEHGRPSGNRLHVQYGRCGVRLYDWTGARLHDSEANDGPTYEDGCHRHSVHRMPVRYLSYASMAETDIAPVLAPQSLFVSRFSIWLKVENFYVRAL